jgi:hypothetical protein
MRFVHGLVRRGEGQVETLHLERDGHETQWHIVLDANLYAQSNIE